MKIKQFTALQLTIFLERQPLSELPNIQVFKKINGAIDDLRKQLGDFYQKYRDLELAYATKLRPYQKEAEEVNRTEKDPKKSEPILAGIQAKADADKALMKALKEFNEFQEVENPKEVDLEIKSPEYESAVKDLLNDKGLKWPWLTRGIFSELVDFFKL